MYMNMAQSDQREVADDWSRYAEHIRSRLRISFNIYTIIVVVIYVYIIENSQDISVRVLLTALPRVYGLLFVLCASLRSFGVKLFDMFSVWINMGNVKIDYGEMLMVPGRCFHSYIVNLLCRCFRKKNRSTENFA